MMAQKETELDLIATGSEDKGHQKKRKGSQQTNSPQQKQRPEEPRKDTTDAENSTSSCLLWLLYATMGILLFSLMLFCTVLSKMSFINITNQLRLLTWCSDDSNSSVEADVVCIELNQNLSDNHNKAVTMYWYILLILMIPNLLTFLRSLIFGMLCKSSDVHPWPKLCSIILVSLYSNAETSYIAFS